MSLHPWDDPGWRAEAEAWAAARLAERGLAVEGEVEQPHLFWWSTVLRLPTAEGDFFFKATRPEGAFEGPLTELLAAVRPEAIAELVATDHTRGWLLTRDAGARLREATPGPEQAGRWAELLPRYAELQLEVAPRAGELLALGVPDFRLAELPRLARAAFGEVPDGLEAVCVELAALGIPASVQHDDLHDGNAFVRGGEYVFFDWGDACVSHPFHTLAVTLRALAYRQELEPGGAEIGRLVDAYLEPWTAVAPRAELQAAAALARRTGTVARALAWHRYAQAMPEGVREEYEEAVPYGLQLYLDDGPWGTFE